MTAFFPAHSSHIPRRRNQRFAAARSRVRTGRGANHFAVDKQIDASLARVAAATDQEVDEGPLDR